MHHPIAWRHSPIVEPASRLTSGCGEQVGALARATLKRFGAARVERAPGRDRVKTRHRAVDLPQPLALAADTRDRLHQPDRVGVVWLGDDRASRPDLDNPPGI